MMHIRKLSRITAVLLAVITVFAVCTGAAQAANDEDYIYYSDLFYGYSPYYLGRGSAYFNKYIEDTYGTMTQIRYEYEDSTEGFMSVFRSSLDSSLDLMSLDFKSYLSLFSSNLGLPDYTYENALDSANAKFVKVMVGSNIWGSLNGSIKPVTKQMKTSKKILKVYNLCVKEYKDGTTYAEVAERFGAMLNSEGVYENVSKDMVTAVYNEVLAPELAKEMGDGLGDLTTVYNMAGAMAIALMIEDVRMDMIDSILQYAKPSSSLYAGMTRLKSQLRSGWKTYFLDNYGYDTLKNFLTADIKKAFTSALDGTLDNSSVGAWSFVVAVGKVASMIIFDWILDTPSLEDMVTQRVLTEYTSEMIDILAAQRTAFNAQFTTGDIETYENTFAAYIALTNVALSASEDLEISSNKGTVEKIKNIWHRFSYKTYIESVKATIANIPADERVLKESDKWTLSLPVTFSGATDSIVDADVYLFNGALWHDLVLTGTGTVSAEANEITIRGDLTGNNAEITLSEGCNLIVNGNYTNNYPLIFDHARMEVMGDVTLRDQGIYSSGGLCMTHDDDYLLVHGDFTTSANDGAYNGYATQCYLTAGTVELKGNFIENGYGHRRYYNENGTHKTIFSGNATQTISFKNYNEAGNWFKNLYLENTDINFSTPIYQLILCQDTTITGTETLTVCNTLDLNGYSLTLNGDMYVTGTLDTNDGQLYLSGNLNIPRGIFSVAGKVSIVGDFQFDTNYTQKTRIIFNNGYLEVQGNVLFSGNFYLEMTNERDYFLIDGDFTLTGGGLTYPRAAVELSAGILELKGDLITKNKAVLSNYASHTIIFSGSMLQTVDNYFTSYYDWYVDIQNPNVNFTKSIYNLTLCADAILTGTQSLDVEHKLDLNGHTLYFHGTLDPHWGYQYFELVENGGHIVPHILTATEAAAATCAEEGHIAYWTCSVCGKLFGDELAETELTAEELVVPVTEHDFIVDEQVNPTCTEDGKITKRHCSVCGTVDTTEVVLPALGHEYYHGVCDRCGDILEIYKAGDTDGDDEVTAMDVIHLANCILDEETETFASCDVNNDGAVDVADIVHLLRYLTDEDGILLHNVSQVLTVQAEMYDSIELIPDADTEADAANPGEETSEEPEEEPTPTQDESEAEAVESEEIIPDETDDLSVADIEAEEVQDETDESPALIESDDTEEYLPEADFDSATDSE